MRKIKRRLGVWVSLVKNTVKVAFEPKRDTLSAGAVLLLGALLAPVALVGVVVCGRE
jgi:hypothetical protein